MTNTCLRLFQSVLLIMVLSTTGGCFLDDDDDDGNTGMVDDGGPGGDGGPAADDGSDDDNSDDEGTGGDDSDGSDGSDGDGDSASADRDDDGIPDSEDNCPADANPGQADADDNGVGDACDDATSDLDGDGAADGGFDNCPAVYNPDQADDDGDGIGNACDPEDPDADTDGDGVPDGTDNCRQTPNPGQADSNGDGIGDACQVPFDTDADDDGIANGADNCVYVANPDQNDSDQDGIGDACDNDQADAAYKLRVIYVVPSDREPQPGAVERLQAFVLQMQDWYANEMDRNGYGEKTFAFESEEGGAPLIHVLGVEATEDDFVNGGFGAVINAIGSEGFPVQIPGEVLLVVSESHRQLPSGEYVGGLVGGTTQMGRYMGQTGWGIVTGDFLARLDREMQLDTSPYGGKILPGIGPYMMVQDVTFPWFEGTTISSVSSSAYGAVMHEVAHGFGLHHNFIADQNFNGNLLGNGLRGIRGYWYPEEFPDNTTRLSRASALMLNSSRFFNPYSTFIDETVPTARIESAGIVPVEDGECVLEVSLSDQGGSGLAGAVLVQDGAVADQIALNGETGAAITFRVENYLPGNRSWEVTVFDRDGNQARSASVPLSCMIE